MLLELPCDTLLPLCDAQGVNIGCVEGVLWITQEGDRSDTILEPGGSFEVSRAGKTLVVAVRDARVRLLSPAKDAIGLICRPISGSPSRTDRARR